MSKLIYVDRLKKDILDLPNCYNGFSDTYDKACIIGVIDEQPTVEERKTGKWIPHSEKSREYIGTVLVNVTYDYWFCDACGYRVEKGQPMYNFCPNCGSRMESAK